MDLNHAEQSFRELERLLETGQLDIETYRQRLAELRVLDNEGRTWMMQERTGRWYVWTGDAWVPGEPRKPAEMSVPPPPAPALVGGHEPSRTGSLDPAQPTFTDRGKNLFGMIWRLVLWAIVWGAIGYALIVEGDVHTDGILVMIGLAVASLLFLLWQLTRVYEGVIERVQTEQQNITNQDGSVTRRRVTYAYIRTANNKVKKVTANRGFEIGDRVYKRRGDWGPRKVKA